MSERDLNHDPIDKAYVEAEALLGDEAAGAARRARLLAAVAAEAAPDVAPPRRSPWPQTVWLVAASVAGLALFMASQPNLADRFRVQAPQQAAAPPPGLSPGVQQTPAAPLQTPAAAVETPPPPRPRVAGPRPVPRSEDTAPPPPPPVMQREVPPPEPGPPPPPPIMVKPVEKVVVPPPPPRVVSAPPPAPAEITSSRADASASDLAAKLRAAAAADRTVEVQALLAQGAVVDEADEAGYTALMKAVQADHPDVAAALRRRGASLEVRNRAGQNARDMAAAVGDAKLDQVLGLAPALPDAPPAH